jgi:hypothetical protein
MTEIIHNINEYEDRRAILVKQFEKDFKEYLNKLNK